MMKRFLLVSLVFAGLVVSCGKDNDDPTPPVNTKSVTDYLVDKTWKFEKVTFTAADRLKMYKRSGTANTANFPNDAIVFKRDGTGTYTNTANVNFVINWQFQDSIKSEIKYTVLNYDKGGAKPGTNVVVTMENVNATDSTLKYAEIYENSDGSATVSSVKRIPF